VESAIYPPAQIANSFFQCFDGSAIQLFRRFLKRLPHVRKWIVAADFSLHNKDRPLDCFAFTILPYDAWTADIERDVTRALPKDLKESKKLGEKAVKWLRDPHRFHIAITVNDDPAVFSNGPGSVALTIAREHIAKTRCPAGTPDRSGHNEHMWFDYLIRAADWFAGAVAAWDRKKNLIPADQPKYQQMLEDVITPAENIVILHLDITDTHMQFRRVVLERTNG
jgi:hypothetical protein